LRRSPNRTASCGRCRAVALTRTHLLIGGDHFAGARRIPAVEHPLRPKPALRCLVDGSASMAGAGVPGVADRAMLGTLPMCRRESSFARCPHTVILRVVIVGILLVAHQVGLLSALPWGLPNRRRLHRLGSGVHEGGPAVHGDRRGTEDQTARYLLSSGMLFPVARAPHRSAP